jgi:carbonic anhydrase/acetyltransferase-like protein (isoleucine patch superfamily)
MIRKNPRGDLPEVHESAFVDPTAILCGRVIVCENVFIGPYVVIRADEVDANGHMEPIVIGAHSNIQDGVVIHSKSGAAVTIGERTSIAHRAIVHGVIVLFVQIGALRTENMFPDKHLRLIDLPLGALFENG